MRRPARRATRSPQPSTGAPRTLTLTRTLTPNPTPTLTSTLTPTPTPPLTRRGQRMQLADTAGIRRPGAEGRAREDLDRMSVTRALETVEHSHAYPRLALTPGRPDAS